MAVSLAPAFASFSLSLPPAAAAGRVAAGGVSFSSSSSFGQVLGLVCVERKVAVLPRLAFSVRSNGGFIPAEHRWMHKGIENKGDNRTYYPKAADHENAKKQWYIVDASDKCLGSLASTVLSTSEANTCSPTLPPLTWEPVLSLLIMQVNGEKVAVTSKKRSQALYRWHSGRPCEMTEETFDSLQHQIPG
ncbi:unnamed protein product [Sphagnum troendelagicum]